MEQSHKLYILINKQLSRSQQAVQACHASIEFAKQHPEWKHQSLVLLVVEDQDEMDEWLLRMHHLKHDNGVKYSPFFESYWDDALTAIAAYGCDEQVKDLPLL